MRHNGSFATRESPAFDTERHDVENCTVFGRRHARPADLGRYRLQGERKSRCAGSTADPASPTGREDKQLL